MFEILPPLWMRGEMFAMRSLKIDDRMPDAMVAWGRREMTLTFPITTVREVIARGIVDAQPMAGSAIPTSCYLRPTTGSRASGSSKTTGYICAPTTNWPREQSHSAPTPRNATPAETTTGSWSNAGRSAAMTAWISSTPMALRP
ncbi:hypothetical protein GGQ64_004849 [Rhizobium azooxidifex]|uniref:Uncharacterized protein n=1 Tax=Mycoplana azooxidifex TaxID=1636188 RepID=A0A7W6DFF4_9HYPH|nr:hypothetical protein [Mycoplana azooxidifex]